MRNAINKDFFREIKYTLNRYVSILLIVALGVAYQGHLPGYEIDTGSLSG